MRYLVLVLAFIATPLFAQDRDLEAERRALDVERRALEAERRALDAERRGEAERRAATGGSAPAADPCIAADVQRQRACTQSPGSPLYQAPQCAEAMSRVRQYCSR